jgi:hypothetical protein
MPVGFQSLVSGTSIVQIDADGPPVLQLLTYGTIPTVTSGGYRTAYVGLPTNLNPSNTLVFIKPGVGGQAKITNFFIGSTGIFFESDTSQTTLDYYIFGPPISSNSGLELRNVNGTLVFTSNNKPCILENLWTNVSYSSPPTMVIDSNTAICSKNDVSYCYASGPGPPGPGGGSIGFTNYYRRKLPYYSGSNVLWNIITAMDTFADSFTAASIGDVSKSTVISTKVGDINISNTDYIVDSVNWPDLSGSAGTTFNTSTQVISGMEVPVILGVSSTSDGFPVIQFNVNSVTIAGSNVLVFPGQSVGFSAFRGTSGSNTVTVTNVNTGATIDTFVITFTGAGSITGSLSSTLENITVSGTGSVPFIGSLSSTLGSITLDGVGSISGAITGSLSSTLGDVTVAGTGSVPFIGSLSSTLGNVTVAGTGSTFTPVTVTRTSGTGATETVPTGATSVRIRVGGGGGGGGRRGSTTPGGGGGEGGFCERTVTGIVGGNTFTYTVGAGGAGRANNGAGTAGGTSTVSGTGLSATMTANGGAGGLQNGTGGAGGTATNGTTNITGNAGNSGATGGAGGTGASTQSGEGGLGAQSPEPSEPGFRGEIEFYYT